MSPLLFNYKKIEILSYTLSTNLFTSRHCPREVKKYRFFCKSIPETLPTPYNTKLLFPNINRFETVAWHSVLGP